MELATLEWVLWFNHHRLLEPIDYIPMAEAEDNYYRQFTGQVEMASFTPNGRLKKRAGTFRTWRMATSM